MAQRLAWKHQYCLGLDFMDADHEESVGMINAVVDSADADLPTAFTAMVSHLDEHFARENAAMAETGFFAAHCHEAEHTRVIAWLRAVAASGDRARMRAAVENEVPTWLLQHLSSMDLVTARFILEARAEAGAYDAGLVAAD